jgi:hypothetical protein
MMEAEGSVNHRQAMDSLRLKAESFEAEPEPTGFFNTIILQETRSFVAPIGDLYGKHWAKHQGHEIIQRMNRKAIDDYTDYLK